MPPWLGMRSWRRWLGRHGCELVLAGLVPIAFALRTCGLDWDRGFFFHPDERQILMVAAGLSWPRDPLVLLTSGSPLNPRFFAYGSFPIYLLRLLSMLAGLWRAEWAAMGHFYLLGRLLSAFFDTVTVVATYLLARKVFGRRVAVLAATFVTFTVLHIQLAHFYTVDTLLTPLILLAVSKAVDVARSGRRRDGAWLGVLLGMALATKVSVLPLAVVVIVAWLAFAWPGGTNHRDTEGTEKLESSDETRLPGASLPFAPLTKGGGGAQARRFPVSSAVLPIALSLRTAWRQVWRGVLLTFALAALCFVLLQPYALIDAYSFVVGVGQEIAMAQGWYDFPYTRQYAGTLPYLYQARQILLFAMGVPLGLLGFCGLIWLCWRVWRRPWREGVVLLSWPLLYAVMQGAAYAKFIRYTLPLLPFLCLAGAALWVAAWDGRGAKQPIIASGANQPVVAGRANQLVIASAAKQSLRNSEQEIATASTRGAASPGRRLAIIELPKRVTRVGLALLLGVVIASAVFYASAFLNVYRQPHPWLQATAWLCQHVPAGSTILTEYWDDPLPLQGLAERGGCPLLYTLLSVDFHTLDKEARLEELLDAIEASDYIVLSSQRLYAALLRSSERYPLASRYYQQLFAEQLGFQLVAAPAVYPQAVGITLLDNPRSGLPLATPPLLAAGRPSGLVLDLGQADESFTVYDHPQPLIFARVERLSRGALRALLRP